MKLTFAQKQHFMTYGYVHVPGVVPQAMVNNTLQAINHSVGQGMNVDEMPFLRAQSFCPELKNTPVITDLFNKTPAIDLAKSVIGDIRSVGGGQVALRFPVMQDPPGRCMPHLDGIPTSTNGMQQGKLGNFTALLGVLLSDLPNPNAGNFTVWPGTHHQYETYFRENGPQSLLKGMPPIDMPEPVQILGKAGDIVLVHYLIAHGVTPNVSPHVRYACFFRLFHVDHEWEKTMLDKWAYFPGIREITE